MIYLCCTKKLLNDLHLQAEEIPAGDTNQSILGNWYVHVIRIMRKKALLFVSERTLFSFISFDFSEARKIGLNNFFLKRLNLALKSEGFDETTIQRVTDEAVNNAYSRAVNRSVIGNLNELAWHYRYRLEEGNVLSPLHTAAAARNLNRMPQKNLGWKYSIEILTELLNSRSF